MHTTSVGVPASVGVVVREYYVAALASIHIRHATLEIGLLQRGHEQDEAQYSLKSILVRLLFVHPLVLARRIGASRRLPQPWRDDTQTLPRLSCWRSLPRHQPFFNPLQRSCRLPFRVDERQHMCLLPQTTNSWPLFGPESLRSKRPRYRWLFLTQWSHGKFFVCK